MANAVYDKAREGFLNSNIKWRTFTAASSRCRGGNDDDNNVDNRYRLGA